MNACSLGLFCAIGRLYFGRPLPECLPVQPPTPPANFDFIYAGKLSTCASCITENPPGLSLSSIHVVMDFCLLIVPRFLLWKIKASALTKFRFFVVFCMGGMSCIGSVLRQLAQTRLESDYSYKILLTYCLRLHAQPPTRLRTLRDWSGLWSRDLCLPL